MNNTSDQHLPLGFAIEHYEIRSVLGIGGFGITYKAWDSKLERWIALKEFLPATLAVRDIDNTTVRARSDKAGDYQHALDRFLLEARTLAKFSHPNIVRITDFLEANGTAYLMMEYVDGVALSTYLRRHPSRVAEDQLKAWVRPLLEGLAEVHEAGFLHRDIKPGNIFIRDRGGPILIDFGAARQAVGEQTHSVTGIFTPGYAPVEQYSTSAKSQGPWTDLYALGATMYRCISRTKPAEAPERLAAIVENKPDPLVAAVDIGRGAYSENFLRLIDEMLIVQAGKRQQSARAVLAALDAGVAPSDLSGADEAPTEVREPAPAASPMATARENVSAPANSGIAAAAAPQSGSRARVGRKALIALALSLLLAGGGYGAYLVLDTQGKPQPGPVDLDVSRPAVTAADTAPEPTAPVVGSGVAADTQEESFTRDALLAGKGIVAIRSEPAGAEVALDGVVIGTTPFRHQSMRAGDYALTLRHPLARTHSTPATIAANRVYSLDVELEPATGAVTVLSEPTGAAIELDGERRAERTPATLEGVAAGPHRIRVLKDRHRASEREIEVAADAVLRDVHFLEAVPYGTLTLDISPASATVILPDIGPKYSPGMKLPLDKYRVIVRAPGYATFEGELDLGEGGLRRKIALRKAFKPGQVLQESLRNGGKAPEMVVLPTGSFRMGCVSGQDCDDDEKPVRTVSLKRPVALGRYEVTVGEFRRFVNATGYRTEAERNTGGKEGCFTVEIQGRNKGDFTSGRYWNKLEYVVLPDQPVTCVSWNDAQSYIEWLNKETGGRYRLPTEAEWEYGTRGGSQDKYHFGNDSDRLCAYGNVADTTTLPNGNTWTNKANCSDGTVYPTRVGSYQANAFGLFDTTGNVWDRVQDCYDDSYTGAPMDGSAKERCGTQYRVLRGGSWGDSPRFLRSALRSGYSPASRANGSGFRLAQDLDS